MEKVFLRKIAHRGEDWIGLFGPNRELFNVFVRGNKAVWSRTWKCYLMPFNRATYEKIVAGLQSAYSIENEDLKAGKKEQSKASVRPVVKNRLEKEKADKMLPAFLTDEKGLADWELRQR
jgi:hypothetical protein